MNFNSYQTNCKSGNYDLAFLSSLKSCWSARLFYRMYVECGLLVLVVHLFCTHHSPDGWFFSATAAWLSLLDDGFGHNTRAWIFFFFIENKTEIKRKESNAKKHNKKGSSYVSSAHILCLTYTIFYPRNRKRFSSGSYSCISLSYSIAVGLRSSSEVCFIRFECVAFSFVAFVATLSLGQVEIMHAVWNHSWRWFGLHTKWSWRINVQ